jgi:hypothetical protein
MLTRRRFLALAGASTAGIVLHARQAVGQASPAPSLPFVPAGSPTVPVAPNLEILLTEDDVAFYDNRHVYASAIAQFKQPGLVQGFNFTGAQPEHEYHVEARAEEEFIQIDLAVTLFGYLWKTLTARYALVPPLHRLWISRGYIHAEEHTSGFFPQSTSRSPSRATHGWPRLLLRLLRLWRRAKVHSPTENQGPVKRMWICMTASPIHAHGGDTMMESDMII